MDLSEIVSISGKGGLFKVVVQRPDGLVVKPLGEEKTQFVSSRMHVFTPLDGVTVYTDGDGRELKDIFLEMKKQEKDNPPVSPKEDEGKLRVYFESIVPDYDKEKVYASDIKKVLKWYDSLDANDLVKEDEEAKKPSPKEDEEE